MMVVCNAHGWQGSNQTQKVDHLQSEDQSIPKTQINLPLG